MSSPRGPEMSEPKPETIKQFVYQNDTVQSPCVTTSDVSEQFNQVSRRTISKRLDTVHERGEVGRRKVGANTVVWYPLD
jgi:hypothetical protein